MRKSTDLFTYTYKISQWSLVNLIEALDTVGGVSLDSLAPFSMASDYRFPERTEREKKLYFLTINRCLNDSPIHIHIYYYKITFIKDNKVYLLYIHYTVYYRIYLLFYKHF